MTRQYIPTRFMRATKTSDVFEALVEEHGMGLVCAHGVDYESALFSEGFMHAIDSGRLPILGTERANSDMKMDQEYHHMIVNGECLVAYFTPEAE
jgi:hypothetical protein